MYVAGNVHEFVVVVAAGNAYKFVVVVAAGNAYGFVFLVHAFNDVVMPVGIFNGLNDPAKFETCFTDSFPRANVHSLFGTKTLDVGRRGLAPHLRGRRWEFIVDLYWLQGLKPA